MTTATLALHEFVEHFVNKNSDTLTYNQLEYFNRVIDLILQFDEEILELENEAEHSYDNMLSYSSLLSDAEKEIDLYELKFDKILDLVDSYLPNIVKQKIVTDIWYCDSKEKLKNG